MAHKLLQDDPQKLWVPERDTFLREFIRLEGRGDAMWFQACHGIRGCKNEPVVRCRDCEGLQMYCQSCIVSCHCAMPLHNVEVFFSIIFYFQIFNRTQVWTGKYFQRTALRDLGLRVQLGHPVGRACCNPSPAFDDEFMLLDINGIHRIVLNFCNCESAQAHAIQLLRVCWYPATTTDPRTAATFRLLDHFQMYTFESKGSAFEYYQALSRLSDNTGTKRPKVCIYIYIPFCYFVYQLTPGPLRASLMHEPTVSPSYRP